MQSMNQMKTTKKIAKQLCHSGHILSQAYLLIASDNAFLFNITSIKRKTLITKYATNGLPFKELHLARKGYAVITINLRKLLLLYKKQKWVEILLVDGKHIF